MDRERQTASARGLRIVVLRSTFNAPVVDGLLEGAREALAAAGLASANLHLVDVPGAFELPLAAQVAASSGRYDAVIALGAVIRGDTDHYEHIARAASEGLSAVALGTGVPVAFGVLTVTDEAQARARSAPGEGNKGAEAARAALAMVQVVRRFAPKASGRRKAGSRGRTKAAPRSASRRRGGAGPASRRIAERKHGRSARGAAR